MSLINIFTLDIDLKQKSYISEPVVTSSDTIRFIVNIFDDGLPFDLTSLSSCSITHKRPDGTTVIKDGTKTGNNQLTFDFGTTETLIPGKIETKVQLYDANGRVSTIDFNYTVNGDPSGDTVLSQTEKTLIEKVLIDGPVTIAAAEIATTNANNAATNANTISSNIEVAEAVRVSLENTRISNETIRDTNETTRTTNENSRLNAELDRVDAESTRVTAENTRLTQETTRDSQETTRQNNESTRNANETARQTSEDDRINAESSRTIAEATRESNETTRQNNETTRSNSEFARLSAEAGRVSAETDRSDAETSRNSAEGTRISQETTRENNESTRNTNETTRQNQEATRESQESTRQTQETTRQNNESTRNTNEAVRQTSEDDRINAESSRVTAETSRIDAEINRSNSETSRVIQESSRVTAESSRSDSEDLRNSSEASRATAETTRQSNESTRQSNEADRVTAESNRSDAETLRETNTSNAIANLNTAIDNVIHKGQYDPLVSYVVNNSVSLDGNTYRCILPSIGNLPTDETYWTLEAQKGANGSGTVASVTSTNGDISVGGTPQDITLTLNSSSSTVPNTIIKRDVNGRSQVADPSSDQDITNKVYVDTELALKESTSNKGQPNGYAALDVDGKVPSSQVPLPVSDSAATPDTLMSRDSNGRSQVANPSVGADIANKDYVDTGLGTKQATIGYIPEDSSKKGEPNGYAPLDGGSVIPAQYVPLPPNTYYPAPWSLMGRDGDGRSQVAAPSISDDIANKGYVDGELSPIAAEINGSHLSVLDGVTSYSTLEEHLQAIKTYIDQQVALAKTYQ